MVLIPVLFHGSSLMIVFGQKILRECLKYLFEKTLAFIQWDRLVGLGKGVCLASGRPEFKSCFHHGSFSRSSHTSNLKIGTPVVILPSACHYRVSAGTGWLGVSIVCLASGRPEFSSHFHHGSFSRSSHTSNLEIGALVVILLSTWHYRVSAGAGWPGVSILWLGEIASLICIFSVWQHIQMCQPLGYTSMLQGRKATNKLQSLNVGGCLLVLWSISVDTEDVALKYLDLDVKAEISRPSINYH